MPFNLQPKSFIAGAIFIWLFQMLYARMMASKG